MGFAVAALIFVSSLIIPGIIGIVKARMCGKKSPSILQPLYEFQRLIRKGSVYSSTTTLIFQLAPVIFLATVLVALLFVPLGHHKALFSFKSDFVYMAYLLGLGKFMMILSALDTGSGFEGMGANREALYSMLVEPVFFIFFAALALLTCQTSLQGIFADFFFSGYLSYFIAALGIYLLFQIALIENSRLLIDDPKTHLELTMVHEVMILDNSGFDLALIHLASWLKFGIFSALIANFLLSPGLTFLMEVIIFFSVSILFGVFVGLLESFKVRNRMATNSAWILAFSSIALVIFMAVTFMVSR